MKNKISVTHVGVTVYISVQQTKKRGEPYTEYVINDYTSGERHRHVRATEADARIKAKEVCEALAGGKADVLEWNESQRRDIHQALKLIEPTGTGIDRAAFIFAEAVKIVGADEILTACNHWRNNRPDKPTTPKKTSEAVKDFLASQKAKVSEKRHSVVSSYMNSFLPVFGERNLHEITANDLEAWMEETKWGAKTYNEVLGALGLLFQYASIGKRDWVPLEYNPAAKVTRRKLKGTDIQIFEPWEARQMLERIETDYAELIPFIVLWCFSGCRKEESARVTWQQVNAALKTGKLELLPTQTKTGQGRTMPLLDNARAWLVWWQGKYGQKQSGTVLPASRATLAAMGDITKLLVRNCGIVWKDNACRHSYITYRCLVLDSTVRVADECGNSPSKIEKHYRRKAITKEQAKEWFSIMPPQPVENVVLLAGHALAVNGP